METKKLWQNRKEKKEWTRRLQSEDPGLEEVHPQAAGIESCARTPKRQVCAHQKKGSPRRFLEREESTRTNQPRQRTQHANRIWKKHKKVAPHSSVKGFVNWDHSGAQRFLPVKRPRRLNLGQWTLYAAIIHQVRHAGAVNLREVLRNESGKPIVRFLL